MKRVSILSVSMFLILTSSVIAQIAVPPGFVVEKIMDRIDGQTPRLEAIRNPAYGFGITAASVENGILKVLRISHTSVQLLGSKVGFPAGEVRDVRFDKTGMLGNALYISVSIDGGCTDQILATTSGGVLSTAATIGACDNRAILVFDLTDGSNGYLPGMYLEDLHNSGGSSLYHIDEEFAVTQVLHDHFPSGRTNTDIFGMEFDPTARYDSYLTVVDTDKPPDDDKSVIYQLRPDYSWAELSTPVSTSERSYRDLCFSPHGSFGQVLYITDRVSNTVMTVDPCGVHQIFASGFGAVESITVDDDGEFMYVSDYNGVYRIRASTTLTGPLLSMQEPRVPSDGVFTDPSGASSIRLLWNEPIIFDNDDVHIINESGQPVSPSVSGSNSQFMIIAFGETLLNDRYTITIRDTVVSATTGNSIDGDEDGLAGGDAVIVMEHRERYDGDNDNDVDLLDFAGLVRKWLWQE